MNPQKGTSRVPFRQYSALEEPRCSPFMSCFPNEVLIHRRIWGREPVLNLPSKLFTYKITSISETNRSERTTNVSSCLFRLMFGEERLRPQVSTADTGFTRETYLNPVEYHPMTPCHLMESVQNNICEQIMQDCAAIRAPSKAVFTLPTRPWTTPNVCATVIRASSWVNRSNLWRTASISVSPRNFLVNFSEVC